MVIEEVSSGKKFAAIVELVTDIDLKKLTKKRYFFTWKDESTVASLFKLTSKDDSDIKGVMALVDFPDESRIEIRLLAVSKENVIFKNDKGKREKEFRGIAGNLIAFACRMAVLKYGIKACVSLLPKTELKSHYIQEYGMIDAGYHVFLELSNLQNLLIKYGI